MALSDRDRAILDFEGGWWKQAGPKEAAIRERFDLSSSRYYQLLGKLVDSPEALDHFPLVVTRLRRSRLDRFRSRFERPSYWGVLR